MGIVIVAIAGVLMLAVGAFSLAGSLRMRRESGLPIGRVLSSDVGVGTPGKPLYSPRYDLTGTPDYLVQTREGTVPVEVKPGRNEDEPYESHLLQVLAYCLLLEENGERPPYGLLRYSNATFRVDYNPETRAYLLDVLDEMRLAATQPEVARSHDSPPRCRACAYRSICDQALQ